MGKDCWFIVVAALWVVAAGDRWCGGAEPGLRPVVLRNDRIVAEIDPSRGMLLRLEL